MLDVVSSENREKTLRFVLTFYWQATDRLPTHYQQSANCRLTVSRQVANISGKTCRLSVGRQVFWGALLHNYRIFHNSHFPHFSFSYYLHTFKYYSSIQALYLYIFLYFFLLDIFTLCIFYTLIFHTLHSLHSTLWVFHQTGHVGTKSVFIMKFYLKNIPENGFKMV